MSRQRVTLLPEARGEGRGGLGGDLHIVSYIKSYRISDLNAAQHRASDGACQAARPSAMEQPRRAADTAPRWRFGEWVDAGAAQSARLGGSDAPLAQQEDG